MSTSPFFYHSPIINKSTSTHRQTAERVRGLRPTVARRKFILEDRRRALRAAGERLGEMERGQAGRTAAVGDGLRWYMEQVGVVGRASTIAGRTDGGNQSFLKFKNVADEPIHTQTTHTQHTTNETGQGGGAAAHVDAGARALRGAPHRGGRAPPGG